MSDEKIKSCLEMHLKLSWIDRMFMESLLDLLGWRRALLRMRRKQNAD